MKYKTLKLLLLLSLIGKNANAMDNRSQPRTNAIENNLNIINRLTSSSNEMILQTIMEVMNQLQQSESFIIFSRQIHDRFSSLRAVSYSLTADLIVSQYNLNTIVSQNPRLIEESYVNHILTNRNSETKLLYLLAALVPNLFPEDTQIVALGHISPKQAARNIAFAATHPSYITPTLGPNLLKSLTELAKHQLPHQFPALFSLIGRIENEDMEAHPFKSTEIPALIGELSFCESQNMPNAKKLKILGILYHACREHFNLA